MPAAHPTPQPDWDAIRAEAARLLGDLPLTIDVDRVMRFSAELAAGRLGRRANLFPRDPEPVGRADVDVLEALPEPDRGRHRQAGARALAAGEVAVVVLNGGMATRFGGVVKGTVEAVGGRSFLEIKRDQSRSSPFLIMNSFATHRATLAHLEERGLGDGVEAFLQDVSLRLTPTGDVFRDGQGQLSLYAPGHGDFVWALRESGLLARLEERGVRTILLSNVDNLGATPDPEVVGYHLSHGRAITCEVAEVLAGDAGGTPARVDGRIMVVEGFRFSPGFDFSRLHYLATNTYLFSTEVLREPRDLSWFYVEKQVAGRTAVQMERLVNELTTWVETAYLATPRSGLAGRFFPIKSPADLERLRADPALVERFAAV